MSLFLWIVLGLIAGFVASHLVDHRGEGMVLDILLGIVDGHRRLGLPSGRVRRCEQPKSIQHRGTYRWRNRLSHPVSRDSSAATDLLIGQTTRYLALPRPPSPVRH